MGNSPDGYLYYGYVLGTEDKGGFAEYDKGPQGFITKAEERLERQWPDGPVEIARVGHREYGTGYILAVEASRLRVSWSQTELLDLGEMSWRPAWEDWDAELKRALEILQITPAQERPGWLLACGYG